MVSTNFLVRDHSPRAPGDYNATNAKNQAPRREKNHAWLPLPQRTPSRLEHSGRRQAATVKLVAYRISVKMRPHVSSSSAFLDRGKNLPNLRIKLGKLQGQDCLSWMQYQIQWPHQLRQVPPDRRPHAPPYAIAVHRASQHLTHSKPYARAFVLSALQIKRRNIPGKMFFALLVNRLKVSVLQQS